MYRKCIGIERKMWLFACLQQKERGVCSALYICGIYMKISGISMIQASTCYSSASLSALTCAIINGFRSHSLVLLL